MVEIIPAILVKTEEEFRARFRQVEPLVSWVQIDIVDGKFAPNVTWNDPLVMASLKTSVRFEIDLMVADVEREVGRWLGAVPQVGRILVHEEALRHDAPRREVFDLMADMREQGIEFGLSLNPETDVEHLFPYIDELDAVLLLGVSPGFGGQKLQENVIKKVALLREKFRNLPIEVDGGVSAENARALVEAGATRLAAGSFLFKHPKGPMGAIEELTASVENCSYSYKATRSRTCNSPSRARRSPS